MLESFRKHKKILLLLSGVILIVILTLMVMSQNKNSKFSDVNLTQKVLKYILEWAQQKILD